MLHVPTLATRGSGVEHVQAVSTMTHSLRSLALAAGLAAAASTAAQDDLSFEQALERLYGDNKSLAAAGFAVGKARAQADQARSARWPTVGLEGQAVYWSDPVILKLEDGSITFPDLPVTLPLPTTVVELERDHYQSALATAKQPLYTGGRIQAGVKAADAATGAAEQAQRAERGRLALELVRRYFGQQLADQSVQVRQATLESLAEHLADARKLEQEGQIARAERLRAEVAWAEAQRELGDAERKAALARSALAAILDSDRELKPSTPIPDIAEPEALDTLQQRALAANPQLRQAGFQRTRAQQGVQAVRGEYAPAVGLFALARVYDEDPVIEQPDWALGVSVTVPLFDGFQRRHKLQAAQAQVDQVEALQAAGERDVSLLVEQRYQQLANARDQIESYETTRALAEESLRAQQLAFAEGLANSLDVIDAELSLSRLLLGIHAARFDALVAHAGLLEASGEFERIRDVAALAPVRQGEE